MKRYNIKHLTVGMILFATGSVAIAGQIWPDSLGLKNGTPQQDVQGEVQGNDDSEINPDFILAYDTESILLRGGSSGSTKER